jgi:hypothetical protein
VGAKINSRSGALGDQSYKEEEKIKYYRLKELTRKKEREQYLRSGRSARLSLKLRQASTWQSTGEVDVRDEQQQIAVASSNPELRP